MQLLRRFRRQTLPSQAHLYAVGPSGIQPFRNDRGNPLTDAFHGILSENGDNEFTRNDRGYARAYKASGWAFRCVMTRARTLASIPIIVQDENGNELPTHPMHRLLKYSRRLMDTTERDLLVFGRAYWSMGLRNGVSSARRLNPQTMYNRAGVKGLEGFYQEIDGVCTGNWAPHEMSYFWDYDPDDDFNGVAPLSYTLSAVGVTLNVSAFAEYYFKNGAFPSGILVSETRLSDPDRERVLAEWRAKFQGLDNSHGTALLEKGRITYQPLTPPLNELAMVELSEEKRRDIAGPLGVPPVIAGITDAANFATAQEQRLSFYTETLLPELDFILDTLNTQVMPLHGVGRLMYDVSMLDVMQEDKTELTTRNQAAVGAGYMSVNEARQREGLDPLQSDFFLIGGQPIDRVSVEAGDFSSLEQLAPSGFPFSLTGLTGSDPPRVLELPAPAAPADRQRVIVSDTLALDLRRWQRKIERLGADTPFYPDYLPSTITGWLRMDLAAWDGETDRDEWVRAAFQWAGALVRAEEPDTTPEEFERFWRDIEAHYEQLIAEWDDLWDVNTQMIAGLLQQGADMTTISAALDRSEEPMVDLLVGTEEQPGPIAKIFIAGTIRGQELLDGEEASAEVLRSSLGIDWDLVAQLSTQWGRRRVGSQIRGINKTTIRLLEEKIVDWVERGGTLEQFADWILGKLPLLDIPEGWSAGKAEWALSRARARLIAQTETTAAFFEGNVARWQQVGVTRGTWRTQREKRVCKDICRPLHNQVGELVTGWTHPDNGKLYRPPAHPGCRCFAAPKRDG